MGCDIHGSIEKRVNGRWVMVDRLISKRYGADPRARNYDRFARLAGVRGPGPEPRGVPEDVSESTMLHIEEWGVDAHSFSFLPLHEAAQIFLDTDTGVSEYAKDHPAEHYFDISEDICRCCKRPVSSEYRLVFWFDN